MTRNTSVHCKVSTLALAVALVAGPTTAVAQSLQGSGTFAHGSGAIDTPDSITTNITIDSPQAVIDWTPDPDGGTSGQDIVFQAGGTTATFSSTGDFAVLNRIDVNDMTRMIRMDGTINSLVNGSTGGAVYFYSPSGIVLGATSAIDVGSLVLTSRPVTVDGNGNFINGGTVEFGTAADPFGNSVNPSARIETHPLSSISALAGGSYVALVAPRVQHHGTINVDGSAALVGAEAATITFRTSGLFDIQFDVGTTDGNGVAVYGDITGPASSGSGDNHRVYLAAVPKNTAMTMLIAPGAELGFDVAQAADVVGNTVVLSAGHDVFIGSARYDQSSASGAAANVNILNASFTSAFAGTASGDMDVTAAIGGATNFASDVNLRSSGGYIQVESFNANSVLNVDGNLSLTTDRVGNGNGQSVTAGQAAIYAQSGGQMFIDGGVNVSANGYGGESSVAGINAGNGTGGQVLIQAEADSFVTIAGNTFVTADGYGGPSGVPGVDAGNGQGGSVFIGTIGDNARIEMVGTTTAHADGQGGNGDGLECGSCDGLGGSGTGGTVNLGTSVGTGSTAYFGDVVMLSAEGLGGRSIPAGTTSGTGFGGTVNVYAGGGSQVEGYGVTFASDLFASADGRGGDAGAFPDSGVTAGLGDGGTVRIYASADSTMGLFGDLEVDANGFGGYNDNGDGGDGLGGQVSMFAEGGNAFIYVEGTADLEADGEGSTASSDCTECGGIGGDGIGGTVQVFNANGIDNSIDFGNSLDLSAEGYGGIGVTGVAGIGDGGFANVNISNGFAVTVGAALSIEADGNGGLGFNGNAGGAGIGGGASIDGSGGTLTVTGITTLDASGIGGSANLGDGGNGGSGTGGGAAVQPGSGTFNFLSSLLVIATGEGGDTDSGIGGNGLGGRTVVNAAGSTIHVTNNLRLDGSAVGGNGAVGGNATALVSNVADESDPIAAGIYAMNDGSLDVDGLATLVGEAVGGNGTNGNGGNASAGEVDVVAFFGDITVQSLSVDANAYGGNGGNGGNGGVAQGGAVDITFGLGAAAVGGVIDLGSALVTADGLGGAGGDGVDGAVGGNGGTGGNGTGGNVSFAGTAAGGMLHSGGAIITILGEGGAGGAGGTGLSGAGGTGGAGGIGRGGFVQTGTISADQSPTSGGGATYTSLSLDAGASGGIGGAGGTGSTVDGVGGNGGDAFGGRTTFLVRGVLVTANTVSLSASATGGDGGSGSTQGDGGDAATGTIAIESKDRFNHATQRGTLQANSITGSAIALAGGGDTDGTTTITDGSYFRVLNGDATIGSVSITLSGDAIDSTGGPSRVSVRDGFAEVQDFSFTTTGQLTLDASSGQMRWTLPGTSTITLSADTFVTDTDPAPSAPGSYQADIFDISTGGDFVTNANLISGSGLTIDAPGSIVARNINVVDAVDLSAGLNATTGNIVAGDSITVVADTGGLVGGSMNSGGAILLDGATGVSTGVLGNLTAAGNIQVLSGGAIVTGITTSNGGDILVDGDGSVSVGSVNAAGSATLLAGTSFDTGDIDAGGPVTITATAGSMDIGNMNAGGDVNLTAGNSILAEDVITPGSITASSGTGLLRLEILQSGGDVDLSSGSAVSAGNVTASGDIIAQSGGDMTLADLTAGNDVSLDSGAALDAGIIIAQAGSVQASAIGALAYGSITAGTFVTIDPTSIVGGDVTALAGDVNMTGDSIDIGNVSASDNVILTALAGDLSTLDIDAGLDVTLDASGDVTTGDITAGGLIDATGASLTLGNLNANSIDLTTTVADLTVGNVTIPGNLTLTTAGDLVFGNLSAFDVDLSATLSMTGGNIDSTTNITANAGTNLSAGDLVAGGTVSATAGSLALGDITANIVGLTSNTGDIGVGDLIIFSSLTVDSAGDFQFGSIVAPLVDLNVPGSIVGGDIDSETDITAVAGGGIDVGDLFAGGATIEGFQAGSVQLTADAAVNTGLIDALGSVDINAGGSINTGDIIAAGLITLHSTGGGILTGNLTGTDMLVDADAGDFEFGDVDSNIFDFDASGAVNGGDIVAVSFATGSGGGAIVLGNITVTGAPPADEFSVGISSATSIQVGDVSGTDKVGFATFGDLVTGDIQTGNLIMALIGGDITTGSLTATGINSEIYFADSQMYVDAGGLDDNFDLALVLNAEPIPTGGSITINGPVAANFIRVATGGLLSLNGDVTADSSSLMSGDIQLGNGVTVSGFTGLYSINANGTFVGDGLTGPGYMLSNAEYNAFDNVSMEVRPDLGAAALLVLGNLNIGSSITEAAFGIEDADDNDVGTIRVVGDVRMNNEAGELFFESETFQLDAATGSIVISADGTTPGGELIIAANNIHVAEGSILDQLADDPQYTGYRADLNAPASTPRPNGVIRAGTVTIEFGSTPADLYTLYVQNMGTAETPAGFVITDMNLGDDGEGTLPAGSVDLIINGQIITGNGTLTGIDVRDLLVQGRDLAPFTGNSTINGCALVGECFVEPPPPPETPLDRPDFQPSPGIQQEIVLAKDNVLPPPEFGNEDFIDDNDEETDEGETSAIAPPDPLFDTSELGEETEAAAPEVGTSMRSSPGLTQPGDVDDPVSGSGNPALMETQTPPSGQEQQQ